MEKIGEGTYGTVFRAVDQTTGLPVALKKVKVRNKRDQDKMPTEAIREIESQGLFAENCKENDAYIVRVVECYVGKSSMNLVYRPYCRRGDLS